MQPQDKDRIKKTRRGSGAITLVDVAKLAGVAPITASRAVNTPGLVSAEVLKKVQDAVQRTGYVPNRMAGGLASSRSPKSASISARARPGWFWLALRSTGDGGSGVNGMVAGRPRSSAASSA